MVGAGPPSTAAKQRRQEGEAGGGQPVGQGVLAVTEVWGTETDVQAVPSFEAHGLRRKQMTGASLVSHGRKEGDGRAAGP